MDDRDDLGGAPVCYLDEADPAYAGYLTREELRDWLAATLARVAAARAGAPAPLAPALATLQDVLAVASGRLGELPASPGGAPDVAIQGLLESIRATLPRLA